MSESTSNHQGSLFGGLLIIAGSAIGAGMLGIPLVTGIAGFWPSVAVFFFCWLFMSSTALLLLEANLFSGKDCNIFTMAEKLLGLFAKAVSFMIYIFLIYSMLVAYVDASGPLIRHFFQNVFNISMSDATGSILFAVFFGFVVFLGTLFVDRFNRLLMLGLGLSFFALIFMGSSFIKGTLLSHRVWGYSLLSIPVVISSFGYHNVIPTLTSYLHENKKKMTWAILIGGAIPLIIYILWEALILAIVPLEVFQSTPTIEQVISYIKYPKVVLWLEYFAFFAILTSFLAQALALLDFLRDAFKVKATLFNRSWLILLVILPPLALALSFPGIFVKALGYVGGFAAMILFVILPALMVWVVRYKKQSLSFKVLPGGRGALTIVIIIGICIMALEFIQEFLHPELLKQFL